MSKRALQRMAKRMVKRAGLQGEEGVFGSFGFSSLPAAIIIGLLIEVPYIGDILSILAFGFHRIVLVTDEHTYLLRARPFHRPGKMLGTYGVGPGTVQRVRGKLTFADGQVVWHSPLFKRRAKWVAEAANGEAIN